MLKILQVLKELLKWIGVNILISLLPLIAAILLRFMIGYDRLLPDIIEVAPELLLTFFSASFGIILGMLGNWGIKDQYGLYKGLLVGNIVFSFFSFGIYYVLFGDRILALERGGKPTEWRVESIGKVVFIFAIFLLLFALWESILKVCKQKENKSENREKSNSSQNEK